MTQMEQWSILSNVLNYKQHDQHLVVNHDLSVRAVNKHKNGSETKEEREKLWNWILVLCQKYYTKNN